MIMQSVLDTAKCWSVEPQTSLVCWLYRTTTWSGSWRMWAKKWKRLKFASAHEGLKYKLQQKREINEHRKLSEK